MKYRFTSAIRVQTPDPHDFHAVCYSSKNSIANRTSAKLKSETLPRASCVTPGRLYYAISSDREPRTELLANYIAFQPVHFPFTNRANIPRVSEVAVSAPRGLVYVPGAGKSRRVAAEVGADSIWELIREGPLERRPSDAPIHGMAFSIFAPPPPPLTPRSFLRRFSPGNVASSR